MTAVAVRLPEPRPPRSRAHPYRLHQLPDPPLQPISSPRSLRQRFASDRDLIGLKVRLLVALGLLAALLELAL
jgi:hypothetical protein